MNKDKPNNISLCEEGVCTHCGLCISVCKKQAVSFSAPNACGDIHPIIDTNKCVQCGLCEKLCPQINPLGSVELPEAYYAGWSHAYRKKGSSGGMFGQMAADFLSAGGYVCGAAFDEDGVLRHRLISDLADLKPLLGSKYVTSIAHEVFEPIKRILDDGKRVLFVGVGCQVAALRRFLRKDYDNLLLIDLVCFGAPSQTVYQRYISKLPYGKIRSYSFRYLGSNRPDKRLTDDKGSEIVLPNKYFTYNDGFVKGYCMKKACYHCNYKSLYRCGDITLGDYHSIQRDRPKINARISKGVSLIMVNSDKGAAYLNEHKGSYELFEKSKQQAENTNISLRSQLPEPQQRDEFCKMMCDDTSSLHDINTKFNLVGLKLSVIRFNKFFIEILDLLKDLKYKMKS